MIKSGKGKAVTSAVAFTMLVTAASAQDFDALDEKLQDPVERGAFSGVIRIERDHAPIFERAYGAASVELDVPSAPGHRYKLHSASKPLLATAVMRAVEDERVDLDNSICASLSPCPESWADVTPRHLLSHTSGIPDFSNELVEQWRGDLARTFSHLEGHFQALEQVSPPGETWSYSNAGYVILSRLLEIGYDRPIHEVLHALVFAPAGMTGATMERPPEHDQMYDGQLVESGAVPGYNGSPEALQSAYSKMYASPGAGGVVATAADVGRFVEGVFTGKLIDTEAREIMLTVPEGSPSYAYGWVVNEVDGRLAYRHDGGNNGFVSFFQYFPEERLTIVVLSNRGFTPLRGIIADIHATLLAAPSSKGT